MAFTDTKRRVYKNEEENLTIHQVEVEFHFKLHPGETKGNRALLDLVVKGLVAVCTAQCGSPSAFLDRGWAYVNILKGSNLFLIATQELSEVRPIDSEWAFEAQRCHKDRVNTWEWFHVAWAEVNHQANHSVRIKAILRARWLKVTVIPFKSTRKQQDFRNLDLAWKQRDEFLVQLKTNIEANLGKNSKTAFRKLTSILKALTGTMDIARNIGTISRNPAAVDNKVSGTPPSTRKGKRVLANSTSSTMSQKPCQQPYSKSQQYYRALLSDDSESELDRSKTAVLTKLGKNDVKDEIKSLENDMRAKTKHFGGTASLYPTPPPTPRASSAMSFACSASPPPYFPSSYELVGISHHPKAPTTQAHSVALQPEAKRSGSASSSPSPQRIDYPSQARPAVVQTASNSVKRPASDDESAQARPTKYMRTDTSQTLNNPLADPLQQGVTMPQADVYDSTKAWNAPSDESHQEPDDPSPDLANAVEHEDVAPGERMMVDEGDMVESIEQSIEQSTEQSTEQSIESWSWGWWRALLELLDGC